jgi:hypothetical protein
MSREPMNVSSNSATMPMPQTIHMQGTSQPGD